MRWAINKKAMGIQSESEGADMTKKDRYFEILKNLLNEHYNIMNTTNKVFPDRQQFIEGYITAAVALDVFDQKELTDFIENLHFDVFGMTVSERQRTRNFGNGTDDDYLKVAAYIKKGVELEF